MDHEKFMKRCYELAVSAGRKGFDTFGALLVHDGEILEEASTEMFMCLTARVMQRRIESAGQDQTSIQTEGQK